MKVAGEELLVDFGDTGSASSSVLSSDERDHKRSGWGSTNKFFDRFVTLLRSPGDSKERKATASLTLSKPESFRSDARKKLASNDRENDLDHQIALVENQAELLENYEATNQPHLKLPQNQEIYPEYVSFTKSEQEPPSALVSYDLDIPSKPDISRNYETKSNDKTTTESDVSLSEEKDNTDASTLMECKTPLTIPPENKALSCAHVSQENQNHSRSSLKADQGLLAQSASSIDSYHNDTKADTTHFRPFHEENKTEDNLEANSKTENDEANFLNNVPPVTLNQSKRVSFFEASDKRDNVKKVVSFCGAPDGMVYSNEKHSKAELIHKKKKVVVTSRSSYAYEKHLTAKPDNVKNMIMKAIKSNFLFLTWTSKEILEFVDTFVEFNVEPDETIFKEGDEGNFFYVIETGSVIVCGKKAQSISSICGCGSSFGDTALLHDVPRTNTVLAQEKCKLWAIHREDYCGISRLLNEKKAKNKVDFLKKVKIGNHILGDVLEPSEVLQIALATQNVSYTKGEIIAREGDKGDIFYIIESGNIDVYIKACGDQPIITMVAGQFFGEKALVEEEGVRTATCIAVSNVVKCFCLTRADFSNLLGDVSWLFATVKYQGKEKEHLKRAQTEQHARLINKAKENEYLSFKISDFDVIRTIGVGTFGNVKSVKKKNPPANEKTTYYVLKCQDVNFTKSNYLCNHLRREKSIMEELDHPFIVEFFGEFRDNKYSYFLLELLQGGEVFKLLVENDRFSEDWSRFYSGGVLSAFAQIHSHNIVYRDLKPENLVLDSRGYPKLVDFGLAKKLEAGKTWTLCGTPDYMPPEVITNEGHDCAVDYWGLGVLLFEFASGMPPFTSEYPMDVYKNILAGFSKVEIPNFFSSDLADLLTKLLNPRQALRIGRTYGGTKEIMKHNWYLTLNFDELMQKQIDAPFVPDLNDNEDMRYFDHYSENVTRQEDSDSEELQETLDSCQQLPNLSRMGDERKNEERKPVKKFTIAGATYNPCATLLDLGRSLAVQPTEMHIFDNVGSNNDYKTEDNKKADSILILQLRNLARMEEKCEDETSHYPFQEFTMLSVKTETLFNISCEEINTHGSTLSNQVSIHGTNYVDPIFIKSLDVIDEFSGSPLSYLAPEALAAFCFPNGISIRLLPRCAVEGAKRLQWLGKDSDRYQLHVFTNGIGDRRHGVSITIQEEIFCPDTMTLDPILSYLRLCRKKRKAARIIAEWWLKCMKNKNIDNKRPVYFRSKSQDSVFRRAINFSQYNSRSTPAIFSKEPDQKVTKQPIKQPPKPISLHAKRLAAESYRIMKNEDKGGDICIVEACYVMIGTKLDEQSLVLNALQKLIDVEREDNAVRRRFCTGTSLMRASKIENVGVPEQNDAPTLSDHRISIIKTMQTKLNLSPAQKKIISCGDKSQVFEVDLSLGRASKVCLPLPLPHVSASWGFATLIRCIGIPNLLLLLKLLLMERSILFIGKSVEEVTASACAISELLHPYTWVSAFMPLLPVNMLDIIDAPVPFIAGMVAKNDVSLNGIECDSRVIEATKRGLSVINLSSKNTSITNDSSIISFIQNIYDPVSIKLLRYQSELEGLMQDEKSALNSFRTFFEHGASHRERKILEVMRKIISNYLLSFTGSLCTMQGLRRCCTSNEDSNNLDFYPDKFLQPLRAKLEFQEKMMSTQMFSSYIEEKKNRLELLESLPAKFIANWTYPRWQHYKKTHEDL